MEGESLPAGKAGTETGVVDRRSGGKRRIVVFLTVSLACVALLALLGSQILAPAQGQANSGSSLLIGHPAPDFTLAALSSRPAPSLHLASLKGTPMMPDFWASCSSRFHQTAPLFQESRQHVTLPRY